MGTLPASAGTPAAALPTDSMAATQPAGPAPDKSSIVAKQNLTAAIFRRGAKKEVDFLPGEEEEDDQVKLQRKAEEYLKIWSAPRVGRDLCAAVWRPLVGAAEVVRRRGKLLMHMGFVQGSKLYLFMEEVVWLMDRANLALLMETLDGQQRMLSLREAYELMVATGLSIDQYRVYSSLVRSSYIVQRYPARWIIDRSEHALDLWGGQSPLTEPVPRHLRPPPPPQKPVGWSADKASSQAAPTEGHQPSDAGLQTVAVGWSADKASSQAASVRPKDGHQPWASPKHARPQRVAADEDAGCAMVDGSGAGPSGGGQAGAGAVRASRKRRAEGDAGEDEGGAREDAAARVEVAGLQGRGEAGSCVDAVEAEGALSSKGRGEVVMDGDAMEMEPPAAGLIAGHAVAGDGLMEAGRSHPGDAGDAQPSPGGHPAQQEVGPAVRAGCQAAPAGPAGGACHPPRWLEVAAGHGAAPHTADPSGPAKLKRQKGSVSWWPAFGIEHPWLGSADAALLDELPRCEVASAAEVEATGGPSGRARPFPPLTRTPASEDHAVGAQSSAFSMAFDVYAPNAAFSRKKCPPPQARIFVLRPGRGFLSLAQMHAAEAMSPGIPIKFASVQHGEVQFFGVTQLNLPTLM